mgnify:CR=1 FL=1
MTNLIHIRRYGRNRKATECGAPASKNDVWSNRWLAPFPKCHDCTETIRLRTLNHLNLLRDVAGLK